MPKEKDKKSEEPIKVTDKRMFTPDGDIRDEYKREVTADPGSRRAREEPASAPPSQQPQPSPQATQRPAQQESGPQTDRRRRVRDQAENPGTPFSNFVESLILNAYMSLGMLRSPYQPEVAIDVASARQMIDIIAMLQEKTKGNLTEEEEGFLAKHLADVKLAFVQRTKTV